MGGAEAAPAAFAVARLARSASDAVCASTTRVSGKVSGEAGSPRAVSQERSVGGPVFVEVTSSCGGSLPRVADRPRLLARQDGKRHPQQYTSSTAAALSGEPEAIPEDEQAKISDDARRRWQVLKAEELARKQTRSRVNRLRQPENEARKRSVDIHKFVAEIERQIGLIQQRVHPAS